MHLSDHTPDFYPARWIWLPSERCLQNTFVLFRKDFHLASDPKLARGWVLADSRYRLWVNGHYIQRGPAPSDPRWPEADPIDVTGRLKEGENCICAEVCYFGRGEGTWVAGAPGFLFHLGVVDADGHEQRLVSDSSWLTYLDRAHAPGLYSRWFLRSLQEVFDARQRPEKWAEVSFKPDRLWLAARELPGAPPCPALFAGGPEYIMEVTDLSGSAAQEKFSELTNTPACIRARSIPLLKDSEFIEAKLEETGRLEWSRPFDDWFESRIPGSFDIESHSMPLDVRQGVFPCDGESIYLTYALPEQMAGWPRIVVDAAEGTTIDIIVQEGHDRENGPLWLDSHFFAWSRLICKEGLNEFETLDYESSKWIQLNIRNASRSVKIEWCGFRRRSYDWKHLPKIQIDEPALQKLFDAQLNSIRNGCQETVQDGGGRERQQYSGDCGHQLHVIRAQCGEPDLSARFLRTFSEGITLEGYFLDCWPGYDRLARLAQREMGIAMWGPLLDHGIGFIFDNFNHWMETGRLQDLSESFPRLIRFFRYLQSIIDKESSMLPVSDLGIPTVWLDHLCYEKKRHKQCSFNLYAIAAMTVALPQISEAMNEDGIAEEAREFGETLYQGVVRAYWCAERNLFVDNLPWEGEEGGMHLSDRTLAMSCIYGLNPNQNDALSIEALAECPKEMRLSYPANMVWRFWALSKAGRMDVVWREMREKWASLPSVRMNNSMQEYWTAPPDSVHSYSHCPYAPLIILQHGVLGLQPLEPGYRLCRIRPDLRGLEQNLRIKYYTAQGPLTFEAIKGSSGWDLSLSIPEGMNGSLILNANSEDFSGPTTIHSFLSFDRIPKQKQIYS